MLKPSPEGESFNPTRTCDNKLARIGWAILTRGGCYNAELVTA
jgi:hypothetical protein